jgi:PTH1 family peptidyl-tRNA hydrolase
MQWVIVGLGNPGQAYANHRHNVGFWALEHVWDHGDFVPWVSKKEAKVAAGQWKGHSLVLCCPQTYMNLSGRAVAVLRKQWPKAQFLVIHDELDLPCGRIALKRGGSARGHNGLKSINDAIGSEYARVRIGIGRPDHQDQVSQYVLSSCPPAERTLILQSIARLDQGLEAILLGNDAACLQAFKATQ